MHAYQGGRGGQKTPKICLRNMWKPPKYVSFEFFSNQHICFRKLLLVCSNIIIVIDSLIIRSAWKHNSKLFFPALILIISYPSKNDLNSLETTKYIQIIYLLTWWENQNPIFSCMNQTDKFVALHQHLHLQHPSQFRPPGTHFSFWQLSHKMHQPRPLKNLFLFSISVLEKLSILRRKK